jgi:hypothetical protein
MSLTYYDVTYYDVIAASRAHHSLLGRHDDHGDPEEANIIAQQDTQIPKTKK